jgi:hypothetical protein
LKQQRGGTAAGLFWAIEGGGVYAHGANVTGPRHTRRSGGAPVAATNDEHVRETPETPRVRVRVLTAEQGRALVDDINARMAQLKQQWERSGHTDVHALRGALIFLEAQLPPWVFSGVMQRLKVQQMQPPYHEIRWLMVRIEKKLLAAEAYEYVSKKLANTPARAKTDAIMKSFQKVESELPPGLRLSPPRRPRVLPKQAGTYTQPAARRKRN